MKKSCLLLGIGVVLGGFVATATAADTTAAACPVSGKSVQQTATTTHHGGTVYFCCKKCQKAFKDDASKFASKANQQLVVTGQASQEKCPISGGKTKPGTEFKIGNTEVAFCCKNCRKKVAEASSSDRVDLVFGDQPFGKGFVVHGDSE